MEMGLFQQQSLKLAMTPELSQAIMLLQYPAIELTAVDVHVYAFQSLGGTKGFCHACDLKQ